MDKDERKRKGREASIQHYHRTKGTSKGVARAAAHAVYMRKYWTKHRERLNRKRNDRRRAHPDVYREQQNAWAAANPARVLLTRARGRARQLGLECTITVEDLLPLPQLCPVLGLTLRKGTSCNDPCSLSIDRIDNSKGYVPENVAVISRRANVLKSDASRDELERLVRWLQNQG